MLGSLVMSVWTSRSGMSLGILCLFWSDSGMSSRSCWSFWLRTGMSSMSLGLSGKSFGSSMSVMSGMSWLVWSGLGRYSRSVWL